jgi:hypothetical protein
MNPLNGTNGTPNITLLRAQLAGVRDRLRGKSPKATEPQ